MYTNYMGEVILNVFNDPDTDAGGPDIDKKWSTYFRHDTQGRVVLIASPAAVTGYAESNADLVNYASGTNLADYTGLITYYAYSTTTYATTQYPNDVAGYLASVSIREGELGTDALQSSFGYAVHSAGGQTVYPLAWQTAYPDYGLTTSFASTFHAGTTQIESHTTYGSDSSTTITFFDKFGRPIWHQDAAGFIHHTQYDQKTGSVAKAIADVNTLVCDENPTQPCDFDTTTRPSGWETPSGGGANLKTSYEVDELGRPTKTTDPNGNVTYAVYNDSAHEVRIYPGWDASTNKPTGPWTVVRDDRTNKYTEVLTVSAAPQVSIGKPTGAESLTSLAAGSLQSLSRTFVNNAGQATKIQEYYDLTAKTYSATINATSLGTSYYETSMEYDVEGRLTKTTGPDGMVSKTIYDSLGRPQSDWTGHTTGTLVKVKEYRYDEDRTNGIGDSNLTSVIETVDATQTPAVTHQTTFGYDFRARLTSTTLPDLDGDDQTPNPLVYQTTYDNLNRVLTKSDSQGTETYAYNDADHTVTVTEPGGWTTPVTVQTYDARGLLVSLTDPVSNTTTWQYDGVGRLIKETNALSEERTYHYDQARLDHTLDRLGRKISYHYDDDSNRFEFERWFTGSTQNRQIAFSYSDAGLLSQVSDADGIIKFTYDALGRVVSDKQDLTGLMSDGPGAIDVQYDTIYNTSAQRSQLSAKVNGVNDFKNEYSYASDAFRRLKTVTQSALGDTGANGVADKHLVFNYNTASQVTSIARHQAATATELAINTFHDYDRTGRLTALIHTMDSSLPTSGWGTAAKAGYRFTYDDLSRLSGISSQTDGDVTYTYDDDQLQYASYSDTTHFQGEGYSYDANGNRTTAYIGTNNQILCEGDPILCYSYDDEGNRSTRILYNGGNIETTEEYVWDHRNRLTKVTTKDPNDAVIQTVDYKYDPFNQLIRRTLDSNGATSGGVTEQFFSHHDGQIALQFDGAIASHPSHRYLWNPIAVDQLLADEKATSSAAGTVLWRKSKGSGFNIKYAAGS